MTLVHWVRAKVARFLEVVAQCLLGCQPTWGETMGLAALAYDVQKRVCDLQRRGGVFCFPARSLETSRMLIIGE